MHSTPYLPQILLFFDDAASEDRESILLVRDDAGELFRELI